LRVMEKKFDLNSNLVNTLADQPLLAAYVEINHLKQLYRQGWLRAGITREQCESVADHIFGMMMLAWLIMDGGLTPKVNRDKVLRMVLVHELGEIYAGDIIPADQVAPDEKHRLEQGGLQKVTAHLPDGFDFTALWDEFEAGTSEEARLVRQLDRLEMALQALVYEKQGYDSQSMSNFYQSAQQAVGDKDLVNLLNLVIAKRSSDTK
jgi:putative hydrolase of HD superfamily